MTAAIEAALADPQQTIAELRRQLDECRAELAARNSEYGERIAHQSATVDVLKVMSASPGDPQPVFDLITRHTRELCNANAAALYGFDGELIHLLSVADPRDTVSAAYRRQFPMAPARGSAFGRAIPHKTTETTENTEETRVLCSFASAFEALQSFVASFLPCLPFVPW